MIFDRTKSAIKTIFSSPTSHHIEQSTFNDFKMNEKRWWTKLNKKKMKKGRHRIKEDQSNFNSFRSSSSSLYSATNQRVEIWVESIIPTFNWYAAAEFDGILVWASEWEWKEIHKITIWWKFVWHLFAFFSLLKENTRKNAFITLRIINS